ncbi:MAG: fumarylacetoacetate hydrolase family protein [Deltaproteobacteria bacterium]|nr:fumarylacetoacetate hydrolase family protein [Deltaproteobacteria bacterium]
MKIIRFLNGEGEVCRGVPESEDAKRAAIIKGDIFDTIVITKKVERVVSLLSPIEPPNIFALGFNYGSHAEETDVVYPERPIVFMKAVSSVVGPARPIILPKAGPDEVDYEAELVVVIGKTAKNVRPEEACDYILGYTCGNDVSARDWQFHKQKNQWARGKSFDTFCPLGPWLVTADEIQNPNDLKIRAILNGTVMQDSSTSNMLFDIPTIISDLSESMTLVPGTVIMTGTPDGVGFTREPPVFLGNGDTVTIEIERIGRLTNPVIVEG